MRREEISDLGQMTTPFADYVRDTLGVEAVAMPPFRRVRYDVNLESIASGHVFGIFIDRYAVIDEPYVFSLSPRRVLIDGTRLV